MSYARKVDGNQSAIVAALRARGYLVKDLRKAGDGVPDLLVCRHGKVWLVEVKRAKGGTLTDKQAALVGVGWPIIVARSADEALEQMR